MQYPVSRNYDFEINVTHKQLILHVHKIFITKDYQYHDILIVLVSAIYFLKKSKRSSVSEPLDLQWLKLLDEKTAPEE